MARAPEAGKKASSTTKTKSSISKSQTQPKAANTPKNKEGPAKAAKSSYQDDASISTPTLPVKSVLTSSTAKAASANVETDFPRGAPAPVKGLKHEKPLQEEKGLFNDGLGTHPAKPRKADDAEASAAAPASKKRKQPPSSSSSSSKNKKTAKRSAPSTSTSTSTATADTFRVEHLSYKRLLPGPTVVLVQVVQILPLELIVSLPDQLMANIPITNISKVFRKRLEEEADASSDDDESSSSSEDEEDEADDDANDKEKIGKLPNLHDMFYVGQYLRASVSRVLPPRATSTLASSSKQRGNELWKSSRRAELSLEPEVVNEGVSLNDLKNGQLVLQGYVKSVEDNGYIVDFGLPLPGSASSSAEQGNTLTGFVSFKDEEKAKKQAVESGEGWPKHRATLGGIVSARITKLAENARTCTVGIQQSDIENTLLSAAPGISSLLPGTLISGSITAITPSGLNIRFLSFFTGSVDIFHMLPSTSHTYKVNEKVRARILWTTPPLGDSPTRFALSLLDHIIKLKPRLAPLVPGQEGTLAPFNQVLPIGTFIEQLKIVKIEPEWGLLCVIPGTTLSAFVHISHVSDLHLTSLTSSNTNHYKVGSIHRGRVIGYSNLDGILQLSLQPSVLNRKFMKISDLKIGDVIEDGVIQRLSNEAMFVNIHGNVAGIVWSNHFSDLKLKHPERKFKAGGKVKTRVFNLDPEKNRVVLTLKRSLVNSDLPILQTFGDAKEGMVLQAIVQTHLEKGVLVELFGGLRAFVGVGEIADKFIENINKELSIGQVVKVRITAIDTEQSRLTASIKQAQDDYTPSSTSTKQDKGKKRDDTTAKSSVTDVSGIELGDKFSASVAEVHEAQVVLSLKGKDAKALLSLSALARHRSSTVTECKETLTTGEILEDLLVVSKNPEKGLIIVGFVPSNKPSLVPSSSRSGISQNTEPLFTFDSLAEGQVLEGTIGDQIPTGYFVQLSRGIRGKLAWTNLADDYDTVGGANLKKGTKVKCAITALDVENKKIDLSTRKSKLEPSAEAGEAKDPVVEDIEQLEDGQTIRGFVRSISDSGLFVDIGDNLTARVQIKELFDEYIKDWKPRFAIGQLVSGRITNINKSKNQIELSLRKNDKVKRTKKEAEPTITFEGLQEGQVYKGVVKRVESYGAFIRIQGSPISGLCHKSEITDDAEADWTKAVSVGDEVRAIVINIDQEKHKISFSLKASRMEDAKDSDDEGEEEENDVMKQLNKLVEMQESASNAEDDSDDDLEIKLHEDEEEEEDEEEDEEDVTMEAADIPAQTETKSALPSLKLSAFKWDGQVDDTMDVDAKEDEDSDNDSEESENEAAKRSQRKGKGILINDTTGDLENQAPTSPSDFDRLLLASPNSSYLWIQYMSYYLQLSDADQARQIAQRALKIVNYREEEEKLNIWMAMINLENSYGSEDSVEETFNKAIQANDAKQVYLRTLEVFEQTEKFDKAEALFERFVKKFNMSSKAWTLYGQFLLNRGRSTEARDLLPRSLKSLPKRKHVKTISKFGQMEFKSGEPERARTIFEGIVDTYPKRLDLWWIYIDQEIRLRNVLGVRALFDRVLNQKLSSKKTKSLLKKWLAFEKEHGDEEGAETVKNRAIAYVESLQN